MKSLGYISMLCVVAACGPTAPNLDCKDDILPGDLVVTEVFSDYAPPAGTGGGDTGKEWFEIYNASDHPIELQGLTITSSRTDGSSPNTHRMTEVVIAPAQYFVLGDEDPAALAAYVNYGYGGDLGALFNTGGGQLTLACGQTAIDTAQYDSVKEGHSRELTSAQPPDYTITDDLTNWCQGDATEFDQGNFGTPGEESDCEPLIVGQCSDEGSARSIVSPAPGDLVITEVMPDPSKVSDTLGEWFEASVINDVDLNGIGLDRAGDTLDPDVLTATDCLHVVAGDTVVFARNRDSTMNGGLPNIAGTFTFSLPAGSSTAPGDVQILVGTTMIDAITWTAAVSGKSLQLDPSVISPEANDDPSNFCDGTAPYGLGDLGTPGTQNDACLLAPPAGSCTGSDGVSRPLVKPAPGQLVITEVMPNPAGDETKREWIEITNTGATAFDLNELGIDRPDDSRTPDVIQAAACKSVAPGDFALLARSTDPSVNGGLPAVDATFGFTMLNSAGAAQILDGSDTLDEVTWATTKDGISLQLDPGKTTTTDNDMAASFCAGTTQYGDGSNFGTPGAANVSCAAP
jgi:hypothetical protein